MALSDTADTALARASAQWRGKQVEVNGFYPLISGQDALGARLALIDRAEKSIDAQYFLIKPDEAGVLFAAKLIEAADRGVRVRMLLDDIFTTVKDRGLVFLDRHPNVELRIFNPLSRRGIKAFNFIGTFRLANRRMHNKSFIVDNQVAIVGGRNIAVEYFQLEESGEFLDFDVLVAGPVVPEVSNEFDTYWNHPLSIPMADLNDRISEEHVQVVEELVAERMADTGNSVYEAALNTDLIRRLFEGELEPYFGEARVIVDDPEKLRNRISAEHKIVATEISEALRQAEDEIIVLTPYFIPGDAGMAFIEELTEKGVRVILLTNSLATNNHTAVHSAYMSYRKPLLQSGVELWEARADATSLETNTELETPTTLTLHTKGIIIDGKRFFAGSLNLDPRSIDINTEMGLMIESEELATILANRVKDRLPEMAYRLRLNDDEKIIWSAHIDGTDVVETKEPQTSGWMRFRAWLLRAFPEKQL